MQKAETAFHEKIFNLVQKKAEPAEGSSTFGSSASSPLKTRRFPPSPCGESGFIG